MRNFWTSASAFVMGFCLCSVMFCYYLVWEQMMLVSFLSACLAGANMIVQAQHRAALSNSPEQKKKKHLPEGACLTCEGDGGHPGEDCMANAVWYECMDCAGTGKEIKAEKPMASSTKECPPHTWSMNITTGKHECMKCPAKSGT